MSDWYPFKQCVVQGKSPVSRRSSRPNGVSRGIPVSRYRGEHRIQPANCVANGAPLSSTRAGGERSVRVLERALDANAGSRPLDSCRLQETPDDEQATQPHIRRRRCGCVWAGPIACEVLFSHRPMRPSAMDANVCEWEGCGLNPGAGALGTGHLCTSRRGRAWVCSPGLILLIIIPRALADAELALTISRSLGSARGRQPT